MPLIRLAKGVRLGLLFPLVLFIIANIWYISRAGHSSISSTVNGAKFLPHENGAELDNLVKGTLEDTKSPPAADHSERKAQSHLSDTSNPILKPNDEGKHQPFELSNPPGSVEFFQNIIKAITPSDSQPPKIEISQMRGQNMIEETHETGFSISYLHEDGVVIEDSELARLKLQHQEVSQNIRELPSPTSDIYSGNGIVIPANKNFLHGAVCILAQLRSLGCSSPVEILLDSRDDYDRHTCEKAVSEMGAKCLVMGDMIKLPDLKVGFQLKPLAILLSSFENVLLLDADNWPVRNPDYLFKSEVFLKNRFVLWPDAWQKKTSPLFYELAGIELGEPVRRDGLANDEPGDEYLKKATPRTLLSDLDGALPYRSVESGQLLVSKKHRFLSLVLALFYNVHGPGLYYPILYQGSAGLGDRETFIAAAQAMEQGFYLTEFSMAFAGFIRETYVTKQRYFDTAVMAQRDPQEAFEYGKAWRMWLKKQNLDTRMSPYQRNQFTMNLQKKFLREHPECVNPQPLFLHVNNPKISAVINEISHKGTYDYKQRYMRPMGVMNEIVGLFDWELRFHAINKWVTCEVLADPGYWNLVGHDQKNICGKITGYVELLKKDTTNIEAAEFGWDSVKSAAK